jgi:transcriptional regulator with XRE-family HTH domain
MDIFCVRLREHRERQGWTQSELARRAEVPSPVISRLESGARGGLTLDVARRLARALGVGLDALAGTWEDVAAPASTEDTVPADAAGVPGPRCPRGALAGAPARRRGRPRATASG